MAIKFHPDKNKELSEEEATAKMAEINGAFEKLGGSTDRPTTPANRVRRVLVRTAAERPPRRRENLQEAPGPRQEHRPRP